MSPFAKLLWPLLILTAESHCYDKSECIVNIASVKLCVLKKRINGVTKVCDYGQWNELQLDSMCHYRAIPVGPP